MQSSSTHALFQPLKVGRMQLAHRVAMAPLTRFRANKDHVHGDLGVEYYSQRASVPGTLLVTEATFISPQAGGYDNVPGIYTADQIAAWKRVCSVYHISSHFYLLTLLIDHRCSSCERVLYISPTMGTRTRRTHRCSCEGRRISTRIFLKQAGHRGKGSPTAHRF